MGHPLRQRLLFLLGEPATISQLASRLDLAKGSIAHHLKVLRDAGAVTSERRGNWVFYRISPNLIERLGGIAQALVPGGLITVPARKRAARPAEASPLAN